MNQDVIGIYHDPWKTLRAGGGGPLGRMALHKANPRDEAYMRALFQERYPQGHWHTYDGDFPAEAAVAAEVVLLYPDAIGQGFAHLERAALREKAPYAALRALTGRRRLFVLDRTTRRQLARRRLMERTLAGEVLFTLVFLLVTPLYVLADAVRGRL